MPDFIVTDPTGKEHVVTAPDGATQDQALEYAKSQFASTPGGAAVGNPNIQRQGDTSLRSEPNSIGQSLGAIGGSGIAGGALGYAAPEILNAAGSGLRMLPYPAAQTVGSVLMGAGNLIRGGRGAAAISGAVAGAAGETAGQAAEALGANQPTAEAARLVGGGLSAETANIGKQVLQKYALTPAMNLFSKGKHMAAKLILEKLDGAPQTLTDQEAKFVEQMIAEVRGPAGKTNAPLEQVGSIMGAEGQRLLSSSDQQLISAQARAAGVTPYGQQRELADIGGNLQSTINTRFKGALDARKAEYAANEKARDAIVAQREGAGQSVDTTQEYKDLVAKLKAELKPGLHSPDVASDFENILKQISTKAKQAEQPFGGMGADPFAAVGEKKPPVSFQQIDEVRRQLGEVFRGKPPEGYKAIDADTARKYYAQLSDLQKKYAGTPQAKLLDEYANSTEGLQIFSSKYGKKSTALDQYRQDTFANDPSSLPSAYFKTRASVQALKELTGSAVQVNQAAMDFANKELAGKDAAGVRKWLGSNSEWLSETGPVRMLVDRYATKLEGSERAMRNAQDFASQAVKDNTMLTRQALPAQRAVDLIKSGDTVLWSKVVPAIQQSAQAKAQMVNAVRQVVADQATAKSTTDLFARNIRPFLEQSNIASKAEMDYIAQRLQNIQTLNIPEVEKLGAARRLLLQSTGGWMASAAGRLGAAAWNINKQVPQTDAPMPTAAPTTLRGINSALPQGAPAPYVPVRQQDFVRG